MLLNRYELRNVIGNGNYGQVYEGFDHLTKKQVAVKKLFPEVVSNADLMKITRTEIETLSQIDNPYIIKLIDHGPAGGLYYLVYEFCERGDLKANIDRRKRLSESDALRVVYQMSEALCELQRRKIIHRDIKPENIFLAGDTCKLGDFGLCYNGERVQLNASVGSLGFLSPETQRDLIYSSKADVYSLGICYYEMIHGDIPFTQEQIKDLYTIKLSLQITRKPGIEASDFALGLLRRMVDPNESTRIDCQEIKRMLSPMFSDYRVESPVKQGRHSMIVKPNMHVAERRSDEVTAKPPTRSANKLQGSTSCANLYSNELLPNNQRGAILNRFGGEIIGHESNHKTSNEKVAETYPSFTNNSQVRNNDRSVSREPYSSGNPQFVSTDLLPKLQMALESSKQLNDEIKRNLEMNPSFVQSRNNLSYQELPQSNQDPAIQSKLVPMPSQLINTVHNEGYKYQQPQSSYIQLADIGQEKTNQKIRRIIDGGSFTSSITSSAKQPPVSLNHSSTVANFSHLGSQSVLVLPAASGLLTSPSVPSYQNPPSAQGQAGGHPQVYQQAQETSVYTRQPPVTYQTGNLTQQNISSIIDSYRVSPGQAAPIYASPSVNYANAQNQPRIHEREGSQQPQAMPTPDFNYRPLRVDPPGRFVQEYGLTSNRKELQAKPSRPSILNQKLNLIANSPNKDSSYSKESSIQRDRSFSQPPNRDQKTKEEEGVSPTFGRALEKARERAEDNKRLASVDLFGRHSRNEFNGPVSTIKNGIVIRPSVQSSQKEGLGRHSVDPETRKLSLKQAMFRLRMVYREMFKVSDSQLNLALTAI